MYPYNKCVEGASSRGANNWHYGQGNGCMFGVGCLLDHGHLFKKKKSAYQYIYLLTLKIA